MLSREVKNFLTNILYALGLFFVFLGTIVFLSLISAVLF
jgi:hypothetical protein